MEAKKNKILINCEEAKHICDKSQHQEATFWEKVRLNIRFIYCHITRDYVKKNAKLTKLINDKSVVCMDQVEKAHLKQEFKKELQN